MAGLYIHVPFCASRCIYCDFYSTTGRNRSLFVDRVLDELTISVNSGLIASPGTQFATVYIGGGTPSQLGSADLVRLVDGLQQRIDLSHVVEFTLEVNPEDVTAEFVDAFPPAINRVSMGVQSFVDAELRMLRRRHDARRPAQAVALLRRRGITNISIDLMYGLPGQTLRSFDQSITEALGLGVPHISAYCLSVEEGTPLHSMVEAGQLHPADDDQCNQMNALLRQRLQAAGFVQYEISNYALPGFHSRHNSSYWDGTPYLGLGPGAHSYDGHRLRFWNEPDLTAYLTGQCPRGHEELSDTDLYNERIMLSLRTRLGVNGIALLHDFPSQCCQGFQTEVPGLIGEGLLRATADGHYVLTPKALSLADTVIRRLML